MVFHGLCHHLVVGGAALPHVGALYMTEKITELEHTTTVQRSITSENRHERC